MALYGLRERGEFPKEEGDAVREYKAMHEENFCSSWLREDGKVKEGRRKLVRRMKKKEVTRGNEKRRKKRTKR